MIPRARWPPGWRGSSARRGSTRPRSRAVHATTLFTNALIERKGARTGLITTAGSRTRSRSGASGSTSSTTSRSPSPSRWCRASCAWRCPSARGRTGASPASSTRARWPRRRPSSPGRGATAIAVVFLHAYANPRHEREAARIIARRHPGVAVTTSHEVAPEIREYERASTTVANAYIKPLAQKYLGPHGGPGGRPRHPGAAAADAVERRPHPRDGGAAGAGADAGVRPRRGRASRPRSSARPTATARVLAFDMGGTTAKLSLVDGGEPLTAYCLRGRAAAPVHRGQRPADPHLHHRADRDRGGRRQHRGRRRDRAPEGRARGAPARSRGPRPTGSAAGEPTVTDADFLLGYLNPDYFAGGEVAVDMAAAHRGGGGARAAARARVDEGRVGHPRHREREHGRRGARAHRGARPRPSRLRAALHRRGGTGARLLGRAQARHRPCRSARRRRGWPRRSACWSRRRASTAAPPWASGSTGAASRSSRPRSPAWRRRRAR